MHKLYAFLLLVFVLSLSAFSQEQKINREISGKVVMDPGDGKQESVEYANISLLSLPDSTFLAGTTSDKEGKFSLRLHCDLSQKYLLKTSFTGCLPVWQEISGTGLPPGGEEKTSTSLCHPGRHNPAEGRRKNTE